VPESKREKSLAIYLKGGGLPLLISYDCLDSSAYLRYVRLWNLV
jgi:hypothetical protein